MTDHLDNKFVWFRVDKSMAIRLTNDIHPKAEFSMKTVFQGQENNGFDIFNFDMRTSLRDDSRIAAILECMFIILKQENEEFMPDNIRKMLEEVCESHTAIDDLAEMRQYITALKLS